MLAQTPRLKISFFTLALGIALSALVGGCALSRSTFSGSEAERLQPLTGDELVVGEPNGLAYVTASRELRLQFHAANGWVPTRVIYLYKEVGESGWRQGPTWNAGESAPRWSPPMEGRYRIRGVPAADLTDTADPPEGPEVLLTVDWSAPQFNVGQRLPEMPVAGGSDLDLTWTVSDDHMSTSQRVYLELSEGRGQAWQRLHEIPNRGHYRWRIPNRPMAGARVRLVVEDLAGNKSEVQLPGTLTVTDEIPLISTPAEVRSREQLVAIPYQVNLPAGGRAARIDLWITEDGGDRWRLVGYDEDLESPFEALLDEGRWGFRMVIEDQEGNRSDYPSPGDAPAGEVIVDWTPPSVTWGQIAVRRQEPVAGSAEALLLVQYPFEVKDFELAAGSVQVSYRVDSGAWQQLDRTFQPHDTAELQLPSGIQEPLRLRVSARDVSGNGVSLDSAPFYPSEILNPPDIAFDEVPSGWFMPGSEVEIAYHADWKFAESYPVDLAYTMDQTNWVVIANELEPSGRMLWKIPDVKAREVTLRMRVRSRDGRVKEVWSSRVFGVDGEAPSVVIAGPRSSWHEKPNLLLDPIDTGGSRLDRLEVWARAEGSDTWELAGVSDSSGKSVTLSPRAPGVYLLWPVAIDGAGNRSLSAQRAPVERLFRFEQQQGAPGIRLTSFQNGGAYAGGSRHLIFLEWVGNRPYGMVRLEYSPDDGGTWLPIAHVPISTDKHEWLLPTENIERCRVRVSADDVAGIRTFDQSHIPFSIDVGAPRVMVKNVEPTTTGTTTIHFDSIDPGGAGMRRVWLYTSNNAGKSWEAWPEPFDAESPIEVALPDGDYSFFLSGEDQVGNTTPAPVSAGDTQYHASVRSQQGVELALLHPKAGAFAGGSRHYVFWKLERAGVAFSDRPVSLQYRQTDSNIWHTIAAALPAEGRESWYVPDEEGAELELRVLAEDTDGQRYEAYSEGLIRVDSSAPGVVFVGPRATSARPVVVDYQVSDSERLAEVEIWVRALSTPTWKRVGHALAGQPLTADIADGMYDVVMVAIDQAGNRTQEPVEGSKGEAELLVDTVAPHLEVDGVGNRQQVFHEGDWVRIQPRVQDRHLSSFPVSFKVSRDGGENFQMLKQYHPNGDPFPWRLPMRSGILYLEVTATDLAGNTAREVLPIHVIPKPPEITLLTDPEGSILRGGRELVLEWETDGVPAIEPRMTIEFSTNQRDWIKLVEGRPATGSYRWNLPKIDSTRCRLRFKVERADGLSGTTWSGTFTISTTAPSVKIEGVEPADSED